MATDFEQLCVRVEALAEWCQQEHAANERLRTLLRVMGASVVAATDTVVPPPPGQS